MLSIKAGHDVGYLTGPVAGGREGYYTGAVDADTGEPPGRWYGAGAEMLGLHGEVDADLMEAVYTRLLDPRDQATHTRERWDEAAPLAAGHRKYQGPDDIFRTLLGNEPNAGPERRAEMRAQAERDSRQAVAFEDVTFSAPKSVSVLAVAFERMENDAKAAGDMEAAEAWGAHRKAVEEAVMAGARAAIDHLADKAGYSREGKHGAGAGRWADAHGYVVAQFLQHDSRDRDPHLHVHQAILNRVQCPDGTWRSLDGRAIRIQKAAAGAIAERVMEAYLTATVGVRFETRPDGKAREVVGVGPAVRDLFSSRRRAITDRTQEMVRAFADRYGRGPSAIELTRISQEATLATRAAKSHEAEPLEERLDRWSAEAAAAVKGGLTAVALDAVAVRQQSGEPTTWSEQDVMERALAAVAGTKQTWTASDLTRAISDALPGHLGLPPEQIPALLNRLTDRALEDAVAVTPEMEVDNRPDELTLDNGMSAYARPHTRLYATHGQLAAERELRAAAVQRGAARLTEEEADAFVARFARAGVQLGADQEAAVRGVVTSGARVEVLLAAAGTGKSFVVGAIADAWGESGRQVFGLAASQVATDVLVDEGVTARNIDRWLMGQKRIAEGRAQDDDENFRLSPDDIVVVDEAGMASTTHLAEINQLCDEAGAKLLLVGDNRQLSSVGPGGSLADIADRGIRYELAEVRRFNSEWEREASLRLRDGDLSVLDDYDKHARILGSGTPEEAETAAGRAWLADTLAGRDSILVVGSNDAAGRVNAELRAQLVRLGKVEERGVPLGREGTVAGVGDLVQARRNGWHLVGVDGNEHAPINRATYRVTGVREDGGLHLAPILGRDEDGEQHGPAITLPGDYVAQNVTLGYASTVHAAQGRTVDTAHAVVGQGMDAAGTYVGLTRGRESNTAWVITRPLTSEAPVGQATELEPRAGKAVLADILGNATDDLSAIAEQEQQAIAARSTFTQAGQLIDGIAQVNAPRTASILDRLAAEGVITPGLRRDFAADPAGSALDRLLRATELAGHDPAEVLRTAISARDFEGVRSPAQTVHARIRTTIGEHVSPEVTSFRDLIPEDVPDSWRPWLEDRADAADNRRRELGEETAKAAPQWALETLGPVPDDVLERAEWEQAAGWAAAHREMAGHEDEADPLGAAPPSGLSEKHAVWRAAHAALGLPEASAEEAMLSDGHLRARARAFEREEAWAPRWVGDELAATIETANRSRTDAEIWAARAEVTEDEAEAQTLRDEAARARQEADELERRSLDLEEADTARARWFVQTAATREAADRARDELGSRGVDLDDPAEQVTAEEWLAAHTETVVTEDPIRPITETDLVNEHDDQAIASTVETDAPDIRDTSDMHPSEREDPSPRREVPTADDTAAAVARAQAALAEIAAREKADEERLAEDVARRERLADWTRDRGDADRDAPVDEMS